MIEQWRRMGFMGAALLGSALLMAGCGGAAAQGAGSESGSGESGDEGSGETGGDDEGEAGGGESSSIPAPPEGARGEETRTMGMDVTLRLTKDGRDAGMSAKNWSFEEGRGVVIEATKGSSVTQLAVIYGHREGKGMEGWTPLPTEGKGYTLKAKGGEIVVLDADDSAAIDAEREVAAAEYSYVGRAHPLLAQIIGKNPVDGDKLKLDSEGAVALIGYTPEMKLGEVSAVYRGSEEYQGRQVASLDVKFEAKLTEKDTVYALDLGGSAFVDAKTGWVLSLDLSGKVKPSGEMTVRGKTLKVGGKGKFTLTRKATIK